MANHNYESLIEQLQKETQEKLRKQDNIIAKLEKKIDKMQAANHQQMQTLDVRMQQMMGMFQMFMMNQTIGMNQMSQGLPQSKSAMNVNNHKQDNTLRQPDSDYDSDDPLSDNEYNNNTKTRDHSRSRHKKHHKHKSKKKRKKDKSKREKDKMATDTIMTDIPPPPNYKSRGRSSTTNSQNSNSSRPIPPPPPPTDTKHRKSSRKSKHQSSHSEQIGRDRDPNKRKKQKSHASSSNVEVIDFIEIVIPNENDPEDRDVLLEDLAELELDVDTPSDEESLLYVEDDEIDGNNDPDIDKDYNWRNKRTHDVNNGQDDEESAEDDISILSALKNPNSGIIDGGESDEDSGYSDEDDGDNDMEQKEEHLSKAERRRRKKERKKQKKREKKRKKKEQKRLEKRRKKENRKDKKNSTSVQSSDKNEISNGTQNSASSKVKDVFNDADDMGNGAGENDKTVVKKRSTITGKIKKFGQKFKIGGKDKEVEEVAEESMTNTSTTTNPMANTNAMKKKFGIRGFKARVIKKGNDDGLVDYGDRNHLHIEKKSKRNKRRRGSDSNISNMSIDPWFDNNKKSKKNKKLNIGAISTEDSILEPDLNDNDVTPPPSPMNKGYRFNISDSDSDNEIDLLKLQDDISDEMNSKEVDKYRKESTEKGVEDEDLDVVDYDWTSYTVKLEKTHSAQSNEEDSGNNLMSPKVKPQEVRPHSARINGGKGKKKKQKEKGFFGENKVEKIKEKKVSKNTKGHKRKGSKGLGAKKNKKKEKIKKIKTIDVISESDKKSKGSKKKAPKTPKTPKTPRNVKNKKKTAKRKTKLSPKTSNENENKEEPEVLVRARGQSNDIMGCDDVMEVEYMYANKRLKSIVPKMNYKEYENKVERPEYKLVLEHVIGYNGYDNLCRNNLYTLENGNLVYNIGCLVVVHDVNTNRQKIYSKHSAPITSITVDGRKGYNNVISAASYPNNVIKIWDGDTLNRVNEIKCNEIVGEIRHLNVSVLSGILYLTCGENGKNTRLFAFNNNKAIINSEFRTINNKNIHIYGMIFNKNITQEISDEFIVYGNNILYYCEVSKQNKLSYCKINKLQPKGSIDGKKEKAYHCGLFLESHKYNLGYYILGGASGSIYIGYKNTIIISLAGHTLRIQSMIKYNNINQFISIGYDGVWKVWNIDYMNQKMKEIYEFIHKLPHQSEDHKNDDNEEYESKRNISDYSNKIIKNGSIKVISEDSFQPSNDAISKYPHACYYDIDENCMYIGTNCNSIISISNINLKNGYNDLQIIFGGHHAGIIGIAISPKLDSLIATLSEDGLIRLWNNTANNYSSVYNTSRKNNSRKNSQKRLDNCVALQSLINGKKQNKLKSTVITWSPDGKFIATGYNISKVCLCTAHPLKKCQEIDLSQYKIKNKFVNKNQSINALCFSYNKSNVLAVGHATQLSLFNIDKTSSSKYKCLKWENTITFMNDQIKHLYFSEMDDMLCVVTEKYDTKFYNISMKKKSIIATIRLPKSDIIWWPRIPLTSYILKGLYQKQTYKWNNKSELCDADICQSLKIVASADKFGCIRLHKLPAMNEKSNNSFKYHYGQISKILFIPDSERLISVGLHDRSIIKWSIQY